MPADKKLYLNYYDKDRYDMVANCELPGGNGNFGFVNRSIQGVN